MSIMEMGPEIEDTNNGRALKKVNQVDGGFTVGEALNGYIYIIIS